MGCIKMLGEYRIVAESAKMEATCEFVREKVGGKGLGG